MTSTVALEDFLGQIVGRGLLPEPTLARAPVPPDATTVEAARILVRERLLTPFQARTLLAGQPLAFFVTERYKILEHLGRGGMGEVYLVEHLLLRRVVAMKLIAPADGGPRSGSSGAGAVERFFREARAVATLDHPNVVRVFDMDHTPSGPILVMEYVDGANLQAVVAKSGPLDPARAADAIAQAAAGLGHAHRAGLVHRDVKPGNLLLDRMGTVKVVDLGLARYRDASMNNGLTGTYDDNRLIGTADYQAPEQGLDSGSADARSDVYGLGAALFYLLTGRVPFPEASVMSKLLAHQMKPVPSASDVNRAVPAELAAVASRMMAKRPADRPQTMDEVRAALAPWSGAPLPPPPAFEMPKHPPSAYRLGLCRVGSSSGPVTGLSGPATGKLRLTSGGPRTNASDNTPRSFGTASNTPRLPRLAAPPADDTAGFEVVEPAAGALVRPLSRRTLLLGVGGGLVASGVAGGVSWALTGRAGGPRPVAPPVPPPPPVAPVKPAPTGVVLRGSGSTFVAPAMEAWGKEYAERFGVEVKYSGGGSGKGVTNTLERDLPFGCSDDPVSDKEFEKSKVSPADLLHVPLALGAVVPMVNVPGVTRPLQFTGPLLAQILLGQITDWGDERLSVCSPSAPLPKLPIVVVYREDSSGTTAVWTDYLCKVSPAFKEAIGQGKLVKWKLGSEAKGSKGVAEKVNATPGALGYVELTYVLKEGGRYGHVQNKKGNSVKPSPESVSAAAAAEAGSLKDDLRFSLTDADGDESYPISACTWAILYKRQPRATGVELVKFLRWATRDGQKLLPALKYAPLPDALVARIDAKLNAVEFTD